MLIREHRTQTPGAASRWRRHLQPKPPPASPATLADLWAYLEMPGNVPDNHLLLSGLLAAAADWVASDTGREFGIRERVVFYDYSERHGQGIIVQPVQDEWLLLPLSPVTEVMEVSTATAPGEYEALSGTAWQIDLNSEPARWNLLAPVTVSSGIFSTGTQWFGGIRVRFRAGYEEVPDRLKLAVTALAAYLYDHRGCDMADAYRKSGAKGLARAYRTWHL